MSKIGVVIAIIILVSSNLFFIDLSNGDFSEIIDRFPEPILNDDELLSQEIEISDPGSRAMTRDARFIEQNAHGGSWLDSFVDETAIGSKTGNVKIIGGSASFIPEVSYFNFTSTQDFDNGTKNNTLTNTDLLSIPTGELRIVSNVALSDGFDGPDEQELIQYNSTWSTNAPVDGWTHIDQNEKYGGNGSLRIKTKTAGSGESYYSWAKLNINYSKIEFYMKYTNNGVGTAHYSFIQPMKDQTEITTLYYGPRANKMRYYNGQTVVDTSLITNSNQWYKYTMTFDYENRKFNGWIHGGSYNNYLVANNCNFYGLPTNNWNGNLYLKSAVAWTNVNVTSWFDNLTVYGFQKESSWESDIVQLPANMPLSEMNLGHYGLSAASRITRVQFLVDGAVKAEYETDITSGTKSTIRESDLTSGSFYDIDKNFRINISLGSNGAVTPRLSYVSGIFISEEEGVLISEPVTIEPGQNWDKLVINKNAGLLGELNISILDNAGTELTNFVNIDDNGEVDISGIDPALYLTLKLKARIMGDITINPDLAYWGLSWNASNAWSDTFFMSNRVKSFNGITTADGTVGVAIPGKTKGFVNSTSIRIPDKNYYGRLKIDKIEPIGTSIYVTIYDAQTGLAISGYEDLDDEIYSIDISQIDPKLHPEILLRAKLNGYSAATPELKSWSFNWTENRGPYDITLSQSVNEVYRTSIIVLAFKGFDKETPEGALGFQAVYSVSGAASWQSSFISNIRHDSADWLLDFQPAKTAELGSYDFRVTITDHFGETYSEIFTGVIDVKNNLPGAPELELRPLNPSTTDDLTITASRSVDIEDEPVTYSYSWYKNGDLQPNLTTTEVGYENTTKGDLWLCEVIPDDGNPGGAGAPNSTGVLILNTAPVVSGPVDLVEINEDSSDQSSLDLKSVFFDIDDDELTFTFSGQDRIDITIDDTTKIVKLSPEPDWFGTEHITFTANDTMSEAVHDVRVKVIPQNDPPRLVRISNTVLSSQDETQKFSVNEDAWLNLTFVGKDIDGDTISYSTNRTDNVDVTDNIDRMGTNNDQLSFIPDNSHVGEHSLEVMVSDNNGSEVIYHIIITVFNVNDPPQVEITYPTPGTHYIEGEKIEFRCEFSDPDLLIPNTDEQLTFTWTSSLEIQVLGTGADLDIFSNVTLKPGMHNITLTVKDKDGLKKTDTLTIFIDEKKESVPLSQSSIILWIVLLVLLMIIVAVVFVIMRRKRVSAEVEYIPPGEKPAAGTFVARPGAIAAPSVTMEQVPGAAQPDQLPPVTGPSAQAVYPDGVQPAEGQIPAPSLSPPYNMPQPQLPPLGGVVETGLTQVAEESEMEKLFDFGTDGGPEPVHKPIIDHDVSKASVEEAPDTEAATADLQGAGVVRATEEAAVMHEGDKSVWKPDERGKAAVKKDELEQTGTVLDQIEKLGKLKKEGLITEDEFLQKKAELLK